MYGYTHAAINACSHIQYPVSSIQYPVYSSPPVPVIRNIIIATANSARGAALRMMLQVGCTALPHASCCRYPLRTAPRAIESQS